MSNTRKRHPQTGYLFRREDYKRVKKMDRQQFESFCKNLYMTAYEEGRKSVPGIDVSEVKAAISETKGIGQNRLKSIMASIENKFGSNGQQKQED